MKSKIILALSLLITFAVTSVNAQSGRGRKDFDNDRVGNNMREHDGRRGHISKHDRHRLAMEKRHHRNREFRGRHSDRYGYNHRKDMRRGHKRDHRDYGHQRFDHR